MGIFEWLLVVLAAGCLMFVLRLMRQSRRTRRKFERELARLDAATKVLKAITPDVVELESIQRQISHLAIEAQEAIAAGDKDRAEEILRTVEDYRSIVGTLQASVQQTVDDHKRRQFDGEDDGDE